VTEVARLDENVLRRLRELNPDDDDFDDIDWSIFHAGDCCGD